VILKKSNSLFRLNQNKKSWPLVPCTCRQLRQVLRIKLYLDLHNRLANSKKQMFVYSVRSMRFTHVSEKNKIVFEPSQLPCKLNQNRSVSWHKKPPMTQNRKETHIWECMLHLLIGWEGFWFLNLLITNFAPTLMPNWGSLEVRLIPRNSCGGMCL
jgi:hypothetical protein